MSRTYTTLNEKGFAIKDGWVRVYFASPKTLEYVGAGDIFVIKDVGLPVYAYIDPPITKDLNTTGKLEYKETFIRKGSNWEIEKDYRGMVVYDISDTTENIVTYLGEIKAGYTLIKPATKWDEWKEGSWVTNEENKNKAVIEDNKKILATLKESSIRRINEITYAVELEMATPDEKELLIKWKEYLVLLTRIDTSILEISWPDKPE